VVRAAIAADEPRFSGTTVYRALVPSYRLPDMGEPRISVWLGPRQHCVWYPVSSGQSYSVVAAVPSGGESAESWRTPGRVADVVAAYRDWHDDVRTMLAAADSVTRWALYDRPELIRWYEGAMTVVGDAAHPMLPFGAHGANQAIEDAVALATCLAGGVGSNSGYDLGSGSGPASGSRRLGAALHRYESIRMPRVAEVTDAVRRNVEDHHLEDGPLQRQRDDGLAGRLRLESLASLYGYDSEQMAIDSSVVIGAPAGPAAHGN
jgi:salicylate hydroxylase